MDFSNTQTIYMQIVDWVFEQILRDKWVTDERVPSVRESAVHFEVNPNTVMRAYDYLQNQEIILNKRGIGFFVAPNAKEIILGIRKKHFLEEELPVFYKNLELLNISMDDIVSLYHEYQQKNSEQ
ncbi:MAG: GntR family transcriptional regulator [Bacteroidales bacterium]|nr:GntR family transcriptional regulator [Bacteroidales bacterium]